MVDLFSERLVALFLSSDLLIDLSAVIDSFFFRDWERKLGKLYFGESVLRTLKKP
jgi:hypothetical protein